MPTKQTPRTMSAVGQHKSRVAAVSMPSMCFFPCQRPLLSLCVSTQPRSVDERWQSTSPLRSIRLCRNACIPVQRARTAVHGNTKLSEASNRCHLSLRASSSSLSLSFPLSPDDAGIARAPSPPRCPGSPAPLADQTRSRPTHRRPRLPADRPPPPLPLRPRGTKTPSAPPPIPTPRPWRRRRKTTATATATASTTKVILAVLAVSTSSCARRDAVVSCRVVSWWSRKQATTKKRGGHGANTQCSAFRGGSGGSSEKFMAPPLASTPMKKHGHDTNVVGDNRAWGRGGVPRG